MSGLCPAQEAHLKRAGHRIRWTIMVLSPAWPGIANGLVDIRVTSWQPACDEVAVGFVAQVTDTDVTQGVQFSLQERSAEGNALLVGASLPWAPPCPPPGTEILAFVRFRLTPTGQQIVGGDITDWHLTWCLLPAPTQIRRSVGVTEPAGVGSSDLEEAYEFALADENGAEGANPTDENIIDCAHPVHAPFRKLLSPYELITGGREITDVNARPNVTSDRLDPQPQSEDDGSIGVYFSLDSTERCASTSPGKPFTFYVLARLAGATACGITGGEFRITGIPAEWFGTGGPPPGALILGDPLSSVGCNIAFQSCTNASPVLLFTGLLLPSTNVWNHPLAVEKRNPSLSPDFPCVLVTVCDAPSYTIVCVGHTTTAYLNPAPGTACGLSRVEAQTWGNVKRMYSK